MLEHTLGQAFEVNVLPVHLLEVVDQSSVVRPLVRLFTLLYEIERHLNKVFHELSILYALHAAKVQRYLGACFEIALVVKFLKQRLLWNFQTFS